MATFETTAFTTPDKIISALADRVRYILLSRAFYAAEEAQEVIGKDGGKKHHHVTNNPLLALKTDDRFHGTIFAVDINYGTIRHVLIDTVKNATDLLEDRICKNLGTSDKITEINLRLGTDNLIEGTVQGAAHNGRPFTIAVQMLWNYRYGENSANGVLTIYPQFRGTRNGEPMEGKAQQSQATAIKEAAKAEREAAKAARLKEARAYFSKVPERLARQCEKRISAYSCTHPTRPEWEFIRDAARNLSEEQLDEMFDDNTRTSGDLERVLERQFKFSRVAAR